MRTVQELWISLVGDLGWVDLGSLVVLGVFFLLGLIRGFAWQIGRIVTLVGSFAAAIGFGPPTARQIFDDVEASGAHLYAAYALVFLAAFLVLSGMARLLHSAVKRAGLSFFDRLGGGVLGVATGGVLVTGALAVVLMFGERFPIHDQVQASHAVQISRATLDLLGDMVPEPVQEVFAADRSPQPTPTGPRIADTPTLDRVLQDLDRDR